MMLNNFSCAWKLSPVLNLERNPLLLPKLSFYFILYSCLEHFNGSTSSTEMAKPLNLTTEALSQLASVYALGNSTLVFISPSHTKLFIVLEIHSAIWSLCIFVHSILSAKKRFLQIFLPLAFDTRLTYLLFWKRPFLINSSIIKLDIPYELPSIAVLS